MDTTQTQADESVGEAACLGDLAPCEVLVDVDGPRLFVARAPDGAELLVYQLADEPTRAVWLDVPTDAVTALIFSAGPEIGSFTFDLDEVALRAKPPA